MDYRYETKNEARDFHKLRKAFIIRNNVLEFLPINSSSSHYEYCKSKVYQRKNLIKLLEDITLMIMLYFIRIILVMTKK